MFHVNICATVTKMSIIKANLIDLRKIIWNSLHELFIPVLTMPMLLNLLCLSGSYLPFRIQLNSVVTSLL